MFNWLKKRKKIEEYDEQGFCIYHKSRAGEYWQEYDERHNVIHYRQSDGYEVWTKWNEGNNCVYYRDSNGEERWDEYDEQNNRIDITQQKLKERQEQEFLGREEISRSDLIDIE